MDFMKIIKSLELLLYEVMVWLVFYPLTLWRALAHPLVLMDYADDELDDPDEDRYSDTLSPPIFLAITLGLMHLVELAGDIAPASKGILADDRNLIAFRLVAFALFPLMYALALLRAKGIALDRKTLRAPFYAQCFAVAPFVLLLDSSALLSLTGTDGRIWGALMAGSIAWLIGVETLWFRRELGSGFWPALGNSVAAFIFALAVLAALLLAMSRL